MSELRAQLIGSGLDEAVKWGKPCCFPGFLRERGYGTSGEVEEPPVGPTSSKKNQRKSDGGGNCLHEEDGALGGEGAVDPRDNHATKEEGRKTSGAFFGEQAPDQACGKKPIVETLIGSKTSRLLSELVAESEGFLPERARPEKHFQYEEEEVFDSDEANGDLGDERHSDHLA